MNSSKGHYYYMCGQFHSKGSKVCRSNLINRDFIEKKVEGIVFNAINNDELIQEMIDYQNKISNANTDLAECQLKKIKEDISINIKKLKQLEEEYLNNMLNSQFARERNSKMAERVSNILNKLEQKKGFLESEI